MQSVSESDTSTQASLTTGNLAPDPGSGSSMRSDDTLRLPQKTQINGVAFNEEADCFAIAYDGGFRVYNSDPMEMWVNREFGEGGLAIATMLHRTNYLALVGGGNRPRYPQNKVIIWDDHTSRAALTLEFILPVRNVLLSRKAIVAVLINKVHIYSFATPPRLLASYDTAPNPHGVAALFGNRIAFPGLVEGRIEIVTFSGDEVKVEALLRIHKAPIRAIALNSHYLATASETGTIVRVHDLESSALAHEFRRGLDSATIWSLALSPKDQLAALSDKSTLHVFELGAAENRRHALRSIPLAPKYFRDEWSFVSCQTECSGPGLISWTSEDSLIVLWQQSARWEKYVVLRSTKELLRESKRNLL